MKCLRSKKKITLHTILLIRASEAFRFSAWRALTVPDRSETGETSVMTSVVRGNHLPESLSGPCR
jgi:hypothetical protein